MRCAVLDDYQDVALSMADWARLGRRVDVGVFTEHIADREALVEALGPMDIVVAMRERTRFDRDLLEALPNLKLLVTTGMANASIDLAAAGERGIVVCGTAGASAAPAELAWGLIIALMRHIPEEHASLRAGGRWQRTVGAGLSGRTLGVVGVGKLGTRMIRIARAFEMPVLAWSRSLTPGACAGLDARYCSSLDELLEASDVVTLHLRLTPETRGIIGPREIALMKPDARLVNTARGALVDERALIDALRHDRIKGAALDVYEQEPLPADHPFRSLDNVVTTPHLGYVTEETYRTYFAQVVEDIEAWLSGRPVRVLAPHS